jgi:hypothetical protein
MESGIGSETARGTVAGRTDGSSDGTSSAGRSQGIAGGEAGEQSRSGQPLRPDRDCLGRRRHAGQFKAGAPSANPFGRRGKPRDDLPDDGLTLLERMRKVLGQGRDQDHGPAERALRRLSDADPRGYRAHVAALGRAEERVARLAQAAACTDRARVDSLRAYIDRSPGKRPLEFTAEEVTFLLDEIDRLTGAAQLSVEQLEVAPDV